MSPEQIEVERKAFEAHKPFSGSDLWWTGKGYHWNDIQRTWEAWLARAEKAQRVREALEALISVSMAVVCCPSDINAYLATIEKRAEAARAVLKD